jgi:hypothetical protein
VLIPRETVKATLARISGAWRAVIPEASYSTAPNILAVLREKDPAADARLRALLDREAYATAGVINNSLEKWLRSREDSGDDTGPGYDGY